MSETGNKKNSTMIALAVVLAVAVILSLVLFNQRNSLSAQVDVLTEELAESREAWENTAAEKEAIQEQLNGVQDALLEAEIALEESTGKIGELETELEEAQRVRTEAQSTLNTLSEQIGSLTETLDYARSVLAGATGEPAAAGDDSAVAPMTVDGEDETLPDGEAPDADTEGEDAEEPADETEGEDAETPDADADTEGEDAEETADETEDEDAEAPKADAETEGEEAEEPADETEGEDAEAPEADAETEGEEAEEPAGEPVDVIAPLLMTEQDPATETDLTVPEIPEDAQMLTIDLIDQDLVVLYVVLDEENTITFLYAENLDEAFLEQFIGKMLPVALLSDEEPEGIEPIEDNLTMSQTVIDVLNALIAEEGAEEETAE